MWLDVITRIKNKNHHAIAIPAPLHPKPPLIFMACCILLFDAGPIFSTDGGYMELLHSLSLKIKY
jgi:hypothetical protein